MLSKLRAMLISFLQTLQKAQKLRADFYAKTQGNYWE